MSKQVELHTNHGVIRLELDDVKAPITVANFLSYVAKGHYDGTVFHRVIKGFMVQGGGFDAGMQQKPTDANIQNEANNGLTNEHYTVAMARTALGQRAVLRQHDQQRLPEFQGRNRLGMGLCRVRQSGGRHRSGGRD